MAIQHILPAWGHESPHWMGARDHWTLCGALDVDPNKNEGEPCPDCAVNQDFALEHGLVEHAVTPKCGFPYFYWRIGVPLGGQVQDLRLPRRYQLDRVDYSALDQRVIAQQAAQGHPRTAPRLLAKAEARRKKAVKKSRLQKSKALTPKRKR